MPVANISLSFQLSGFGDGFTLSFEIVMMVPVYKYVNKVSLQRALYCSIPNSKHSKPSLFEIQFRVFVIRKYSFSFRMQNQPWILSKTSTSTQYPTVGPSYLTLLSISIIIQQKKDEDWKITIIKYGNYQNHERRKIILPYQRYQSKSKLQRSKFTKFWHFNTKSRSLKF